MCHKIDKQSLETATTKWARISLVLVLLALCAILLVVTRHMQAEDTTEHPFIQPSAIKSETCLTCHPDKKEGRFVHSAVAMGCENCHQASLENGKTTITLVAMGGELCAMCHQAKRDFVLHVPYQGGQCLICHEPHASNFPGQVRAETNLLCLSCHGVNQPDVKVNHETRTVSLLGGRTLTLDDYHQAVKIGLDRSGTKGHPVTGHPISGRDPRNKDAALNCLSCHVPHNSALPDLMPADVNNDFELCARCHK
jgi:predicted CXXCH cytochrome family protein